MANQYISTMAHTPEEIAERRLFVMQLRRRHMYWDDIARAVHEKFGYWVTYVQCAEDFRVVMRERSKVLAQETDAMREMAIQQLDSAASKIIDKVDEGNLDALEVYLKIQNRKAKLLGIDMPTQVEDVTRRQRMTADQLLAKMAEITQRIKAQRLEATAVDVESQPSLPAPDSQPDVSSSLESTPCATLSLVESPRREEPEPE